MTEPNLDYGMTKATLRPKRKKEPSIWFRADPDMRSRIKAQAKASGVTMSELIRTYVEWGLENDS